MNRYIERTAASQAVIDAMLTLPDEQWTVLYHRYYNGLTFGQIARVLGISLERTRKLEAQGLRTLRHPDISKGLRVFAE